MYSIHTHYTLINKKIQSLSFEWVQIYPLPEKQTIPIKKRSLT